MKLKLITIVGCAIFYFISAKAQTADTAITISAATDNYAFIYNKATQSVQIKEKQTNVYQAETFQSNVSISETYNNQVSINHVTCKVDGRTPRNFQPRYQYYSVDDYFFSDEQICYFPITINGKGSNAEVVFEKTYNDPRYFTSIYFPERFAITNKTVTITIPRWMKVELKEYNFNGLDINKTTAYIQAEDADVITYTLKNLPGSERESNSPGPSYLYPHLLVMCKQATPAGQSFTYFNTLADQYAWYHTLTVDTPDDRTQAIAKAKELTAGKENSLAGIKAVFYYVQDNIRYIAFEDGLAGFKPDKADEVLRKKYGDCKGMTNLLKAMLQAAGYHARLCWLGTSHIAYNYQTPSMAVDNHMICAVNFQGKTYFLDATETNIGFNEYAERIQGRQVLIEDGDKYQLSNIPLASGTQNAYTETGKFSIADNKLSGDVSHQWKGEYKEDMLAMLTSVKKDRADELMRKYLAGGDFEYAISNFSLPEKLNPDEDFKLAYRVQFAEGLSAFGKTFYVDLDRKKEFRDATIDVAKRRHDYWFHHQVNIAIQHELALPAGYQVAALPAPLNVINPDYEFKVAYAAQPGKLTYSKNIRIKNTRLNKAGFARWNQDIEQLIKTYNESVMLKPTAQ